MVASLLFRYAALTPIPAFLAPPDESDPRHNAYDFYAEVQSAPDDLKRLTDEHESMACRRRGYGERALLGKARV